MFQMLAGRRARASALVALALALGAGLTGCGQATDAEPSSSPDASARSADPAESTGPEQQELPESKPLPNDWPGEILVPDGSIVMVTEIGSGYAILVEGVDSDQAKGLIADMASAGLTVDGPSDMGNDEWTAMATSPGAMATYAYASGGAGLPNVAINLTRTE